jgi:hypothetical protein
MTHLIILSAGSFLALLILCLWLLILSGGRAQR